MQKPKLSEFPLIHIPSKHRAVQSTGWKPVGPELINPEVTVARAGTRIVCPKCGAPIGRLGADLYSGMRVRADMIEFESGQKRHKDQLAECTKCHEPYMKHHFRVTAGLRSFTTSISIEFDGRQRWI